MIVLEQMRLTNPNTHAAIFTARKAAE